MNLRGTSRPLSTPAFQQNSAFETSGITAESIVSEALKNKVINCSFENLGRKMTPKEIGAFTTAIEHLAHRKEKNDITDFNISGQELGDSRIKKLMRVMMYCSGLRVLNLEQSKLTVKFNGSLLSFANNHFHDLHLIALDGNDFGTGEPRKIRAMAGAMRTLVDKNKSLTIDALHANFPGEIAKELNEYRTRNNDDSSNVQRIFVTDPSEPYQSTENHFISAHQKSASHESAADKPSGNYEQWGVWCKHLSLTLDPKGLPVATILLKEGNRIFICGPIPPNIDARRKLIDLLQGDTLSPGDNEELTLEFAIENRKVRLTRTMASSPETAATFIQAAFILSD